MKPLIVWSKSAVHEILRHSRFRTETWGWNGPILRCTRRTKSLPIISGWSIPSLGRSLARLTCGSAPTPTSNSTQAMWGTLSNRIIGGNRYASRAVRLLIPIARQEGLNPLWITCDPENAASRRTCELAGGELIEIAAVPPTCIIYRNGHREKCRDRLIL